jgi:hypothetical protein
MELLLFVDSVGEASTFSPIESMNCYCEGLETEIDALLNVGFRVNNEK